MKTSEIKKLIKLILCEVDSATHGYKFREYNWASDMKGFHYPVDVFYGTVYIALLETLPDGYTIRKIDTPKGMVPVKKDPKNKFKTKVDAAEIAHKVWKRVRTNGK